VCQELGRDARPSVSLVAPLLAKRSLNERRSITIRRWVPLPISYAVACRHLEVNSISLDVDYLGRRAHLVTYRRGGEVLYIPGTDRAFTCIQKRPDGGGSGSWQSA
jgi:hypothetical protein